MSHSPSVLVVPEEMPGEVVEDFYQGAGSLGAEPQVKERLVVD